MSSKRAVGIVGVGSVGIAAAYALFTRRAVSELLLVDQDAARAEGEAMDLMHGQALVGRITVRATGYEALGDAAVVVKLFRVLLLLPHTDLAGAHTLARRVCERVARSSLAFDDQVIRPTVSVGLAALTPGREVSFADSSLQYCPTCQTGGKPLADRRMSKLLK